jgi:hypothetical protein
MNYCKLLEIKSDCKRIQSSNQEPVIIGHDPKYVTIWRVNQYDTEMSIKGIGIWYGHVWHVS